ncbi:MAG: hypothetical protein HUU06_08145 [Planctomycetaceae bacterium]|nr:hypothetical protein [Planctomycetota bacterium]NUN52740.1 hypothetical protein [Planctomycetaceae bacterium]
MTAPAPLRGRAAVLSRGHRGASLLLLALLALLPCGPGGALAQDGGEPPPAGVKEDPKAKETEKAKETDKEKEKEKEKDKEKGKGKGKEKEGGKGRGGSGKEEAGGARKGGKEREEPRAGEGKRTEEEVLLDALAAAWKRGDAAALAGNLPGTRRVSLRLPGIEAGDYRTEQARSLLEGYFGERSFTKVERKSVKEAAGTFSVEYVRSSDRRVVKAELLLVLGIEAAAGRGERRVLVGARETP